MIRFGFVFFAAVAFAQLSKQEQAVASAVDAEAKAAAVLLERIVNINSGTFNPPGVKTVGDVMDAELKALGFTTRFISMESQKRAPHLIAERKGTGRPLLLIGHMDTVFEPSSPFQKFEPKPGGRTAVGPGTSDMKGGLVVLITALKALHKSGELENRAITVFLTADEEAPGDDLTITRGDLIAEGKKAKAALCFETGVRGVNQDFASTARRGFTGWMIRSTGTAGHSGQIFTDKFGYGAVYELTRVIDEMRRTLREPNMTFNVGMLLGGADPKADRAGEGSVKGKDNIIPSAALARGEVRALSPEQMARLKDKMYAIAAKSLPGTKTEITFEEGYPPMAPTAGNKRLLKMLTEGSVAAGLGEVGELDPMQRGAGDISFVAPYVDSLSGLGAIGGGSHAVGEMVDLDSIPRQAKRAALLIRRASAELK
ncbi:peptidase M20 [Bryobacterales bacterium F-183]|nr:peptidase M20 [Bryobacterales bacterium F-183]